MKYEQMMLDSIPWQEGNTRLEALDMEVFLAEGVKYRHRGIDDKFIENNNGDKEQGFCDSTLEEGKIETAISSKLEEQHKLLVKGYFEGYALIFSGNSVRLYEEAKKLGLEFNFFPRQFAELSDICALRTIKGNHCEFDKGIPNYIGKQIAEIGGIIALIKEGKQEQLIYDCIYCLERDKRFMDYKQVMQISIPWQERNVKLKAIDIEISLPEGVKFRDRGVDDEFLKMNISSRVLGGCEPDFQCRRIEIATSSKLKKRHKVLVEGHEEGHALIFSGNSVRLYEEAKKLGLEFDFFPLQLAELSDICVRRLFDNKDYEIPSREFLSRPFNADRAIITQREEEIAEIGGLVALVKKGKQKKLIKEVIHHLENGEVYPIN